MQKPRDEVARSTAQGKTGMRVEQTLTIRGRGHPTVTPKLDIHHEAWIPQQATRATTLGRSEFVPKVGLLSSAGLQLAGG